MYRLLYATFFALLALPAFSQKIPLINSGEVIKQGKILYDSGQYAEAIKEFMKVPERDTNYVLMLAEAAITQIAAEKYDEALTLCEQGLAKPTRYAPLFFRYRAVAEDKKGNLEGSIKRFREAIEKYPADYSLIYNLGLTYYNNKEYEKAAQTFFEVLSFNPFHAGCHLNLGRIAIGQGRKTHAMLSFGMYLSISNSDNPRLVLLNNFLDNQVSEEGSIPLFGTNEAEKLDQIIRAKIAMQKDFKSRIPVDAAVVRQYEMFFQQLNTIGSDPKDQWVKAYLPIYQFMQRNNLIEPFIYHLLASSSNSVVKKWRSRNDKVLNAFFESVNGVIKKQSAIVSLPQFGYAKPVQAWYYNNNSLSALGEFTSAETRKGHWKFYHANHTLSAEGNYDDEGKKTGIWKYYNEDETWKSIEDFSTGEVTAYYADTTRREHFYLKDGEDIHGEVELYFPGGVLKEKLIYENGKRHGKGQSYHENGAVKMSYTYADNKGNGEFRTHYASGVLRESETYKDHVLTDAYRYYHANGKPESEGQYVNGVPVGEWTHYYSNGNLKRKGTYNNAGKPVGEWVYYDEGGVLSEKRPFDDEGRRHGANIHYFRDKIHFINTYKKDMLVQSIFYDEDGKELGNYGRSDGNFAVRNHFGTGQLQSEGSYRKGQNHGTWKFYNRFGKLINEYNYVDGLLQGKAVDYHESGEKKFVFEYKDDELHGYFQEFYRNGNVKQEGWFQEGEREQQWLSYYLDGTLETDAYYLRGSLTGPLYSYAQDGKLYSVTKYEDGRLADITNYDRKGNDITSVKVVNHTANYTERFSNGKERGRFSLISGKYVGQVNKWYADGTLFYSYSFLNGSKSGAYLYNHLNGKPATKGFFLEDEEDGMWQSFDMSGKRLNEGRYRDGERDSVWTYYFSNGKVSSSVAYRAGKSHGLSRYFLADGTPFLEKMYWHGDLIAYRIIYGTEEDSAWEKFTGTGTIKVENGAGKTISEESYKDGLRHGYKRLYYPDGKLHEEYHYANGDSEGPFVVYYPDGKVEQRGTFKDDELNGKLETFKPDGTPVKVETYNMGTRHGPAVWFDKGKKKEVAFWDGIIE